MLRRFAFTIAVIAMLFLQQAVSGPVPDKSSENHMVKTNLLSAPLSFVENQGQFDPEVLFRAQAGGATFYMCRNEVCYLLLEKTEPALGQDAALSPESGIFADRSGRPDGRRGAFVKARLIAANPDPQVVGQDRLSSNSNFFHGNDPSAWRTDVPNYSAIVYRDVYPGIDLKYYGDGRSLKYDFIVHPGADPSRIEVHYDGVNDLSVTSDGRMEVTTGIGPFYERRPYVYQEIDGVRHAVAARYGIRDESIFGFELLSHYDRGYPLIIDPELLYSTFLGGSGWDYGYCVAADGDGNTYVAGATYSPDFPTVNPYDDVHNEESDVFVTKFSPAGNTVLYSTYLGGSFWEEGRGIAVDGSGNAYVTGLTSSDDFPTVNAYDATLGGFGDAFLAKLSPAGNSLLFSTFLGGSVAQEEGWGIAVDGFGSAYVTGKTNSSDFPTVNAYDPVYNGGDAFVTKFSAAGNSLVYSTYLGGSLQERGYDIAVDGSGEAFVIGNTNSSDFPTVNAYDDGFNGVYDVFVTRFSSSGSALEYSTYIGGGGLDEGYSIAVSSSGNAFITGSTQSTDFPLVNAFDFARDGGADAYVSSLSASGSTLLYSSYLGGMGGEDGWGIAVDDVGRAYVAGGTSSSDFPMVDSYDDSFNGFYDVFVTAISSEGNSVVYSTFLGGSATDAAWDVALDGSAGIHIVGETWSTNFPTLNPYDATFNGAPDAFVSKFGPLDVPPCSYTPGDVNYNGAPLELDDVVTMIGNYRGTLEVAYTCGCPPNGAQFAATADPDGNCVALELNDVVTEIAAYRGAGEASGCPDCPGSRRLAPGERKTKQVTR